MGSLIKSGQPPYGWRSLGGCMREAVGEEQQVISLILKMRGDGLSDQQIADALNDAGHSTRRGTPWRRQYLSPLYPYRFGKMERVDAVVKKRKRVGKRKKRK